MAREREIKIVLKIEISEFIKRINKKGFKLLHTLNQTDIYFDTKDWFLYESIAALRLRQIKGKDDSFSFKKVFYVPAKKDYYIEEIEAKFPLKESEKIKEIFNKVRIPFDKKVLKDGEILSKYLIEHGYLDTQKMPKERIVYSRSNDEIVIDNVPDVGRIVEVECLEGEPNVMVKTLLESTEWERSIEGTSYIWLKNVMGKSSHIENLKKFKTDPDWNVWKHERKFYRNLSAI